ncbi:MAG: hypothetical protein K2W95_15580 [Candidatus Obscuribacterales bacterium]|nr:hypothetical protein [Candidatus Obscuribacterales bacterium]
MMFTKQLMSSDIEFPQFHKTNVTFEPDVWEPLSKVAPRTRSAYINKALRAYMSDATESGAADRYRRQLDMLETALTMPEMNPEFRTIKLKASDPINGPFHLQQPIFPAGFNPNTGWHTFEVLHVPATISLIDFIGMFDESVPQFERNRHQFKWTELWEWSNQDRAIAKLQQRKNEKLAKQRAKTRKDAELRKKR